MDLRMNSNVFVLTRRTGHRRHDMFDELLTNIYAEKRRYTSIFMSPQKNAG